MRTRFILVGVGFFVLVLLWFFFLFRPNSDRINELTTQQEQVQQEITNLTAQLQRLRELQQQAPQLRAQLSRLDDALPDDPRIPDFILQIQEAANLAGIDFLSISPSVPAATEEEGQAQAISVSIAIEGRYFEIEDFIIRLERLRRAVRIGNFSLAPGGATEGAPAGASPVLSTTLQMQIFLTGEVAPVAGAAPAPGETPAPGATPVPGETPAPAPTPIPGG